MILRSILLPPGGYSQKKLVGVRDTLPETLTLFQTKICDFPYPISDLTLKSIRLTSCCCTYTVGVNIKREIVLSPNDEEVAFKKTHPIQN